MKIKPGTHRANCWPSKAFGETWMSSGTYLCQLRFNLRSLRTLAVCGLSHWILWLCASCMTIPIGSVLVKQCGVWEERNSVCTAELLNVRFVFLCTPFHHHLF